MIEESRRVAEIWGLRSATRAAEAGLLEHYRRFERRVARIFGPRYVALYETVSTVPPGQSWLVARVEDLDLGRLVPAAKRFDHINEAIAAALLAQKGDGPPGPYLHIMETRPRLLILLLRLRAAERVVVLRDLLAAVCQRCGGKACDSCKTVHPGLGIPQILAERGKVRLYHTGDPAELSGKVPVPAPREFGTFAPAAPETTGIPNDLMTAAAAAADNWIAGRTNLFGPRPDDDPCAPPLDAAVQRAELVCFIAAEMVQVVAHSKR